MDVVIITSVEISGSCHKMCEGRRNGSREHY